MKMIKEEQTNEILPQSFQCVSVWHVLVTAWRMRPLSQVVTGQCRGEGGLRINDSGFV